MFRFFYFFNIINYSHDFYLFDFFNYHLLYYFNYLILAKFKKFLMVNFYKRWLPNLSTNNIEKQKFIDIYYHFINKNYKKILNLKKFKIQNNNIIHYSLILDFLWKESVSLLGKKSVFPFDMHSFTYFSRPSQSLISLFLI